ncbi:hypothetical protein F4818DRAFT_441174 [Hypoxylon cercidicola]|nr:hypothetical protein F4818DRAFT_441174 [Hypoxylon cercidicola]
MANGLPLPTELIQMIFSCFDDLDTLGAAILCCRTFYNAFVRIEEHITTGILLKQIHPDVMSDAFAVDASRILSDRNDGDRKATLQIFLICMLKIKTGSLPPPTVWKLSEALPLSRFHNIVSYFATRLLSTALNGAREDSREVPRQEALTDTEVHGVQRALYRFELYCNMFVGSNLPVARQRDLFFSHFSVLENDQLSCIYGLLLEIASEPHNDLVDHDVPRDRDYWQGNYILSKGLGFLFRLVRNDDYARPREHLIIDDDYMHHFLNSVISSIGDPSTEHPSICQILQATDRTKKRL